MNALLPEPRKGITEFMLSFIKQLELPRLALQIFAEESNDTYTKLMAIKFFKSLLHVGKSHKDVLVTMVRLNPVEKCLAVVESCKTRIKTLNMLHSATFEFINQYGTAVYDQISEELHSQMVEAHSVDFEWCPGLVDKFILPDSKGKKNAL